MNDLLSDVRTSQVCQSQKQQQFSDFLSDPAFPCVGARAALNKQRMTFAEYSSLDKHFTVANLCQRLHEFSIAHPEPGAIPVSLVALFSDAIKDEVSFEAALWKLLQAMHDHDRLSFSWDSTAGCDPTSSDFSFSIAGRAFFVVGLHPGSSRLSRRAPFPSLVFNFHNQFESLKASGKYQSMQAVIRTRDAELQGSINPVLARFGEASEARQYAGRAVDIDWRCPFHVTQPKYA